mmetsp:Transcript_23829/g.38813  ORF Transcript_23829/g.38813 Transcript_23829/m.38813 type:complete len:141 (+) Transcript_23829:140-562(+)
MSERNEADATSSCASCGIAQEDDIKLRRCTACYLVKYCSIKCQRDHRPKHKRECKKRAAELRDELLFKQPESSCFGDCPICCLSLSIDPEKFSLYACCSKLICDGCAYHLCQPKTRASGETPAKMSALTKSFALHRRRSQ